MPPPLKVDHHQPLKVDHHGGPCRIRSTFKGGCVSSLLFSCCQSWPLHHRHTGAIFRAPPDTQVRFSGGFTYHAVEAPRYDFPAGSRLTGTIFRALPAPGYRSSQVRFSRRLQTHRYDFPCASCYRLQKPPGTIFRAAPDTQVRCSGRFVFQAIEAPGTIFRAAPDSQVRFSGGFVFQATEAPRYDFPGGSRLTGTIFRALPVQTHKYDFLGASSPQVRFSGRLQTHRYDYPGTPPTLPFSKARGWRWSSHGPEDTRDHLAL